MELFGKLALVGKDEGAVGEDAVHVEDDNANFLKSVKQRCHQITFASMRSCMCRAPRSLSSESTTRS